MFSFLFGEKEVKSSKESSELSSISSLPNTVPVPVIFTVTETGTLSPAPSIVICSPTAPISLTLPQCSSFVGKEYLITNSSTSAVTLTRFGSDTFNYATSYVIAGVAGTSVKLTSDGTSNWIVV